MTSSELVPTISKYFGGQPGVWPKSLTGPVLRTALSGLTGAAIGRYLMSPVLNTLTFGYGDEDKIRRNSTVLGGLTGLAISGVPAYYEAEAKKKYPELDKQASTDFFKPSISVTQSLQDIQSNPWMSLSDKLTAQMRIREAAQNQGTSLGLLRPASLVDFAGQSLSAAIPSMVAAYGLSKVLGLSDSARNTLVGTSLVAGAWKTYLDRSGND